MTPFEIASTTTMEAILQAYPSAKVGLFANVIRGSAVPLPALEPRN